MLIPMQQFYEVVLNHFLVCEVGYNLPFSSSHLAFIVCFVHSSGTDPYQASSSRGAPSSYTWNHLGKLRVGILNYY